MTQETVQPTPAQPAGMSAEQEQTAVALRQNISESADNLQLKKDQASRHESRYTNPVGDHRPSMSTSMINAIEVGVSRRKVKKANRASKKHYEENESAYIEQAHIEMQSDPRNLGR